MLMYLSDHRERERKKVKRERKRRIVEKKSGKVWKETGEDSLHMVVVKKLT